MKLCCLDEEAIVLVNNNLYLIVYKENYLYSFLANNNMPQLVHILKGVRLNNKFGDNKNDMLELLPNDAKLLIATGDVRETFEYLSKIPCINRRYNEIFFYPTKELMYEHYYRKKYANRPLKKSIIFRSGRDRGIPDNLWEYADNVRALFEYMLGRAMNARYEMVWIVKEPKKYHSLFRNYKNVKVLSCYDAISDDVDRRNEYYETLCLAEFIFVCQSYAFVRNARKDQIRIQLWHGCGFKSNQLIERQEKKYEYMTVTSKMYLELHARSFGLKNEQLLITGLPKNDWLFSPIENWKSLFKIPSAKKYIFWLPTYRTCATSFQDAILNVDTGLPIFKDISMLHDMNSILKEENVILIVKLHPAQDREAVLSWDLSNIVMVENESFVSKNVDINQLLGYADALISDYSSAAVGYMLLDRPIGFTLDDYEFYHGFHWPKEELHNWLPGEEIYNFDDFIRFIRDVAEGKDNSMEKRHRLMPFFHKYCDEHSCERVLEALGINQD